jgi:hypothetical protein
VTIEILVAMVIGFLAVLMVTGASKTLLQTRQQKARYETLYITVLSLKETIKSDGCRENGSFEGTMNGFDYRAECREKKMLRNYIFDPDGLRTGNLGNYRLRLYEVDLEVRRNSFVKTYTFMQTEEEQIRSAKELLLL